MIAIEPSFDHAIFLAGVSEPKSEVVGDGRNVLVTSTETELVNSAVDAAWGGAENRVVLEKVFNAETRLHGGVLWVELEAVVLGVSFEA